MVPDLPVFFGGWHLYGVTHSWRGILIVDPALALLGLMAWFGIGRDPLVDLSPDPIRHRLESTYWLTRRQWVLAIPAAAIGAASHVAWDAFTHANRWGVHQVAWLQTEHAGMLGHSWAQYLSSALGLVAVGLAIGSWFVRRTPVPRARQIPTLGMWALFAAAVIASIPTFFALWNSIPHGLHMVAFNSAVVGVLSLAAALSALSVIWHALRFAAPLSLRG